LAIRDQQVNELTTRLAEATKDLEESTAALEKLRNNKYGAFCYNGYLLMI